MGKDNKNCGRDFVVPIMPNGNGGYACLRHREDHSVQIGTLAPMRDGVPLDPDGQIVQLTQGDGPGMDVEVLYDRRETDSSIHGRGPARITSPEYRSNFDRIFGTRPEVGAA